MAMSELSLEVLAATAIIGGFGCGGEASLVRNGVGDHEQSPMNSHDGVSPSRQVKSLSLLPGHVSEYMETLDRI
ncbi:hypothetical protein U1Q18_014202 [Sarracenia purpurea var. burkii]